MACIAALAAGSEPVDDVDNAGDADPAVSVGGFEAGVIGFLIIVTGAVGWPLTGAGDVSRRWTAALKDCIEIRREHKFENCFYQKKLLL